MAPRSAKTKKPGDVKVSESEAPKKTRGKAKVIEDVEPAIMDSQINEKDIATKTKGKRGKKIINDTNNEEQINESDEIAAPQPAKKGRKKKNVEAVPEEKVETNGDNSQKEESVTTVEGDNVETNGTNEEIKSAPVGKGRKKAKTETAKGKKISKQDSVESESSDKVESMDNDEPEKPKVTKKRGRKIQQNADESSDTKDEPVEQQTKTTLAAVNGKKKGPTKDGKEKSPDSEKEETQEEQEEEVETVEEQKKKGRGRKNQGKKPQPKEVPDQKEEPASKKRKVTKKEDKLKGDSETPMEDLSEAKVTKGKRGKKKNEDEPEDMGEESKEEKGN